MDSTGTIATRYWAIYHGIHWAAYRGLNGESIPGDYGVYDTHRVSCGGAVVSCQQSSSMHLLNSIRGWARAAMPTVGCSTVDPRYTSCATRRLRGELTSPGGNKTNEKKGRGFLPRERSNNQTVLRATGLARDKPVRSSHTTCFLCLLMHSHNVSTRC